MLGHNSKICWFVRRWCCALCAGLLVLPGCSGPSAVARREAMSGFGAGEVAQGGSWEAVLPSPEVQQRLAYEDASLAPEFGRADARLNRRDDSARLATSQWPAAARADLGRVRSIFIRDREGRITYFDAELRRSRFDDPYLYGR